MIDVCLGSFYFSFFIVMTMKTFLTFVAIKLSDNDLKDLIMILIVFDLIILFTIPLLMKLSEGICV